MQYNNMYKTEHIFLNRSFLSDYYLQDIIQKCEYFIPAHALVFKGREEDIYCITTTYI